MQIQLLNLSSALVKYQELTTQNPHKKYVIAHAGGNYFKVVEKINNFARAFMKSSDPRYYTKAQASHVAQKINGTHLSDATMLTALKKLMQKKPSLIPKSIQYMIAKKDAENRAAIFLKNSSAKPAEVTYENNAAHAFFNLYNVYNKGLFEGRPIAELRKERIDQLKKDLKRNMQVNSLKAEDVPAFYQQVVRAFRGNELEAIKFMDFIHQGVTASFLKEFLKRTNPNFDPNFQLRDDVSNVRFQVNLQTKKITFDFAQSCLENNANTGAVFFHVEIEYGKKVSMNYGLYRPIHLPLAYKQALMKALRLPISKDLDKATFYVRSKGNAYEFQVQFPPELEQGRALTGTLNLAPGWQRLLKQDAKQL